MTNTTNLGQVQFIEYRRSDTNPDLHTLTLDFSDQAILLAASLITGAHSFEVETVISPKGTEWAFTFRTNALHSVRRARSAHSPT